MGREAGGPSTRRAAARRLLAGALLAVGCAGAGRAGQGVHASESPGASQGAAAPAAAASESFPVGEKTLREVLAASPAWQHSDREPDADLVGRLREVRPGWEVEVVYGHWCEDSSREVPRFISLLNALGTEAPGVRWVAVDSSKREPRSVVRRLSIERVPTFVVTRSGKEVGRIVERADPSIEAHLLRVLKP